jgi:F-type H+-transporting ATPase subunit b
VLFDSFTIAAQIINFLILLLLLRRFLYRPILKAMDEREARIAAEMAEAKQAKVQAVAEIEHYRQQNLTLQEQREALLFEAKTEADAWRQRTIARVRAEIEDERAQWYALMRQEQSVFLHDVRIRIARQVYAIARKVLADLAGIEVEERIIQTFLAKIRNLEAAERSRMAQAIQEGGARVLVRSAFSIPPALRSEIGSLLHERNTINAGLVFETAPELICGIEARVESYKLAWTLDSYLSSLEEEVLATLAERNEQNSDIAERAAVGVATG